MKILCVGDLHEPVSHPGYLAFCQDLYHQWDCDHVVFIGDVVDWHAISFHAAHPECPGPNDEYELAYQGVQKWHDAFPNADICIGNHDERLNRLSETVNIPAKFLRSYADIWGTPGWTWQYDFIHDDVYYFHGTGCSGKYPASNAMTKMLMSVVMGHVHSAAGIKWTANPNRRIFGMDTGCGVDDQAMQFAYGKHFKTRSMLSAGVVLDGIPYHEIMPCGRGEAYDRDKFTERKVPKAAKARRNDRSRTSK